MPDISAAGASPVLIADADYGRMDGIMETVLETFPFPFENRRVLIKPNMLGPSPPERAVTTHPALIRSLVQALRRRKAHCFVGDNPGMSGYAANEHCARTSGLMEASDGCFINLAKDTTQIPVRSRFIERVAVSRAFLEADLVINVPKFKTHIQTRITGSIKNLFGILVGAEKARVHLAAPRPAHFSEVLVDIYQIRPPDLTIMDAVMGMEGNGPSTGDLRPIGKVLAARNGVTVDGLMAAMMGIPAGDIDMLRIARQRGLGEIDPSKMEIQGSWTPLKKFKMPFTYGSRGLLGTLLNKIFYRPLVKPRLRIEPGLCTRCEVCVRHCPAQALTMGEIPAMDRRRCIACYCCLELCPSRAIKPTGFMKMLSRKRKS